MTAIPAVAPGSGAAAAGHDTVSPARFAPARRDERRA
jgi:hypothetical protein